MGSARTTLARTSCSSQMMIVLVVLASLIVSALGHGRLMDPPSRASQWRAGWDNPPDYDDNHGYCGGKIHQNTEEGGMCGICGDPYDGPWPHQAPGGMYANGNIVAEYAQGAEIEVAVEITTNHRGYFMFRLCPNNDVTQDPEQECFDKGYWNSTVLLPGD